MTDFYGVNADKLLVDVPTTKIDPGEVAGRQRVIYDSYTFAAIIDTTDTLRVGSKIPKGARIKDFRMVFPDLGSTGDFNIGWEAGSDAVEAADADGFGAAVDVNTVAGHYSMLEDQPTVAGVGKKFTEAVQAIIVPSEITTATSGKIHIWIEYVLD